VAEGVAMQINIDQPFDLASTLESGQAFRWRRNGEWYHGVIYGNAIEVRQHLFGIEFRSHPTPEEEMGKTLCDYLRLDDNLEEVYRAIDLDERMHETIRRHRGMRLLRQEPWECLIAFILSANSNIPRISSTMENMSRRLGRQFNFRGLLYHSFPAPEVLVAVGEKGLRALGLGYRASYVAQASQLVAEGALRLDELRSMPYEEAHEALMEVPGVGEKVSDCVLLFSLDKLEAFPIDRWMRRAVGEWYFKERQPSYREVRAWAREYFGPYAGYAQQYLFQGRREASNRGRG